MPRTNQQSSFTGSRRQPCCLPSSQASACSFIPFYMSFASSSSSTQHTIHLVLQSPCSLLSFSPPVLLGTPSYACEMYFWLGGVVWQSGGFCLPSFLNGSLGCCLSRSFSITNTSLQRMIISWSPALCSVIKGLLVRCSGWKVVALVPGVEPRLLGGLPGSLYLWPLILNIHYYVATLVSTVLTLQKRAMCLQVWLSFGIPLPREWLPWQYAWGPISWLFDQGAQALYKSGIPRFCSMVYASVLSALECVSRPISK